MARTTPIDQLAAFEGGPERPPRTRTDAMGKQIRGRTGRPRATPGGAGMTTVKLNPTDRELLEDLAYDDAVTLSVIFRRALHEFAVARGYTVKPKGDSAATAA